MHAIQLYSMYINIYPRGVVCVVDLVLYVRYEEAPFRVAHEHDDALLAGQLQARASRDCRMNSIGMDLPSWATT